MTLKKDKNHKKIPVTMNGVEVMDYLSLDQQKLCFLAKEEHLVPIEGIHASWFKILIGSRDELNRRLPNWLYRKSDVESFKSDNKEYLEEVRQQQTSAISKPQKPSKPEPKYFSKMGRKGGEASKGKKPIQTAIMKYLQEKSERVNMSSEQILSGFKNFATEDNPLEVICDECEWGIYYYDDHEGDGYIMAKTHAIGQKKSEVSIKASTFKNHYIPKAKKNYLKKVQQ